MLPQCDVGEDGTEWQLFTKQGYVEPLRELETVRIKLVKDFIDEPMLVAKFPHPLNCILECVLINIVGM